MKDKGGASSGRTTRGNPYCRLNKLNAANKILLNLVSLAFNRGASLNRLKVDPDPRLTRVPLVYLRIQMHTNAIAQNS